MQAVFGFEPHDPVEAFTSGEKEVLFPAIRVHPCSFVAQCFLRSVHNPAQTPSPRRRQSTCKQYLGSNRTTPWRRSPPAKRRFFFQPSVFIRVHSWPNVFLDPCTILHKRRAPDAVNPHASSIWVRTARPRGGVHLRRKGGSFSSHPCSSVFIRGPMFSWIHAQSCT